MENYTMHWESGPEKGFWGKWMSGQRGKGGVLYG